MEHSRVALEAGKVKLSLANGGNLDNVGLLLRGIQLPVI